MDNKTIDDFKKGFDKFFFGERLHTFKNQYLSHLVRSIEVFMRSRKESPFFNIVLSPMNKNDKIVNFARAQYTKNRMFIVYFHPKLEVKQLRILLAHELGHLLLITVLLDKDHDKRNQQEPIANLFGILAILDKNDFYKNKASSYNHKSPEEIVDSFSLMANREKGNLNVS